MKILIVEDQAEIRDTLRDLLEVNGHEVLAAEDGRQALQLAAQAPDFILCDVNLPELDGYGVLKEVKRMPGVCDVPFVFLTARDERGQVREGMAHGADDYITKPFSEADILNAIASRTKRYGRMREQVEKLVAHHRREVNAQWSHELLTPLNAVMGALELLESSGDAVAPGELKEMLSLIRAGAERQERLARKLIRYFELEQLLQRPRPVGDRCEASTAVTAGATGAARQEGRQAGVTLVVAKGSVAVREAWLAGAVFELVENACKFSPVGTGIAVNGRITGDQYRIEITDQGIGMTTEQRTDVGAFSQFERARREQQGLGLGLAIARSTMQLAGGRLALDDNPAGAGLTVALQIPLAR